MSLESAINELKGIKGYRCAGIMDFTGEMLVSDSFDTSIDLNVAGATFNDIFRGAHEAAGKLGMQATEELIINTPNGVIVMMCSGAKREPHLHLITVLEKGGNHALAKMTMERLIPKLIAELS
ncbi:MAG: hypothetical protein B0D96_00935 [Candidatus Sedimenticola endophacoides]|uniref:Roadblock/LAMTOR2 domain-containing protein n=1 Tax=Candidatus Sedimenticola endophacoides TaxID=2548426 RepID=A0A6N4DK52_9GAMM|nr:MAG: hypothetical protein B0D94_08845 [Candidatus Sedimenticola endophacoides]OQX38012.1 MAG: hypothetical protein B0D96_00935 [Candidatus Sedimenticola endophacoides]OQX38848.1 MAG: hypothetical protein B0D89_11895 [Candidatus Sedimenticola endophacoides]OQX43768.1 MAG: hypothetical protein B0D88_03820 [Candidatus Sedimenticola endophacoides]PUD98241.1 MAG: hypothetical protein C3L24_13105 [Candidatus Sedimenticola endophacoides]